MSRLSPYALLAAALSLAACATQPAGTPAAPGPPAAPASPSDAPEAGATPYGLFLAGRTAMDEGRMAVAADYLSDAASEEGDSPFLKSHAFSAALLSGDIDKAAILSPATDDTDVAAARLGVLVRGVEALSQEKYKQAYALLAGPDVGYPHKSAAMLLAPWAAAGAGDEANSIVRPVISGDPIAQFIADLDQAELFERAGKTAEAESTFKALMSSGDPGGLVSAAYGPFLERQGRRGEAVAIYQAALARAPDDPLFAAAKARAGKHGRPPAMVGIRQGAADSLILPSDGLINRKQTDLAMAYLRLALKIDPSRDEAWVLVGDLLNATGDVEGARVAYAAAKPGSQRYVGARNKLAWSYQNAGDTAQALKLARETVAEAPSDRAAQITLADLLRDDDQYQDSAAVLDKLIDRSGAQVDWRLYYLRASAYDEAGQWPKAEADAQAALKLSPDEPELLNFLGYGWVDRGEHLQEALAMLKRAADAEPQSGAMIDSLGWAYYRIGDYKSAVDKLQQAVSLDPADVDVNDHLGDAYWRAGRKIEAQFQWRRVLTLEPDDATRARVEAKLASPQGLDAPAAPTQAQ